MRISRVQSFLCDAGWRAWTFVKIETDDGLVGWGECSDTSNPFGVTGCIRDFEELLIGQDPRAVARIYWDVLRTSRQKNLGGVSHKAIAGVELALWDIKAKALGVPVYELFGGPVRDRMQVYWSHCGTTRVTHGDALGLPPLRTYDDIVALGREVVARGFRALKTNIIVPGEPAKNYVPGSAPGATSTDGIATPSVLKQTEQLIGALSQGVGPDVQIALDVNYNFRPESVVAIGRALEPFNMQWIEYDCWDPQALLRVKRDIPHRLASCEGLNTTRQYRPYFELRAVDTAIIDIPWNGFGQAHNIGQMADAFELSVAPHNHYSHLANLQAINLCAVLPNVRIMEIDIDDVPWKDDLVTQPPSIEDGCIMLPTGPGWGADINEEVLREHPWPRKSASGATDGATRTAPVEYSRR